MTWAVKPDPTAELRKKVEELEKAVGMAVEQIAKLTRDLHYAIMESSSRPYYVREPRYEPIPSPWEPAKPYVPYMPSYPWDDRTTTVTTTKPDYKDFAKKFEVIYGTKFLPELIKPSSKKEEG